MSSPVVVQGTAVQPTTTTTTSFGVSSGNNDTTIGQQPKQTSCNDPIFVLLFLIAVLGIGATASIFAPGALTGDTSTATGLNSAYEGYVIVAAVISVLSFVGAGFGMAVLMCIPQLLIQVSLIFSVVLSGIMAVYMFLQGNYLGGALGLVFFAISICYARIAWSRIPCTYTAVCLYDAETMVLWMLLSHTLSPLIFFYILHPAVATANLVTAITAVRKNLGVTIVAYLFTILGVIWTILWSLAFVGVSNSQRSSNADGAATELGGFYNFLLLLALFFVQQVIQNAVHVTVAGTVATWWYAPNESGCGTVCSSFIRTCTTSLGSICFGSLLVAIIQALKAMARQAREDGECSALACVAQCILGCIEGIVEYFNKWAFM